MKIITWNVNSINVRQQHFEELLKEEMPAIIGLQELKCETVQFPKEAVESLGYYVVVSGQKTYNGVAFISQLEPKDVEIQLPNFADEQQRLIAATVGDYRVINVYVPNGQEVDSDKYNYKLSWLKAFYEYLQNALEQYENIVVMGDFNIAPTDDDVYAPELWRNKILCSDQERNLFNQILSLGFLDALRIFATKDPLYTWWDYRQQQFEKNEGMRIDHLLLSKNVAARMINAKVLRGVRAKERPSDHAPVSIYLKG